MLIKLIFVFFFLINIDEVSSSHIGQQQPSAASLYAAAAAAAAAAAVSMRSTTSGNSSPVHGLAGPQIPQQPPPSSSAHLLVVPHPINNNKINYTNRPANTGRKFKCKMCPQVSCKIFNCYLY